jgi:hypothetical protein
MSERKQTRPHPVPLLSERGKSEQNDEFLHFGLQGLSLFISPI